MGAASYTTATNPFTLLEGTTQQLYINTDLAYYQTTIGAGLGFQVDTQFKVSLLGNYVYAWQYHCQIKLGGAQYSSCENAPVYATNYFDDSVYYVAGTT